VVHGEQSAAQAFAELLQQQLGWQVTVPGHGHSLRWPDFLAHE
jgi:metallo-beta-lactamase family protein